MATEKQRQAARQNIRKAQAAWKNKSSAQRSRAQPEGRKRQKPGKGGHGEFYHVVVRPKEQFVTFRTQDVGDPGHVERVAGQRSSGSWDTQKWLISKEDAHIENGKLVPDTEEVRDLLERLGSEVRHIEADTFEAKPRRNVPEKDKPTAAQKRARRQNIKKAQAARH